MDSPFRCRSANRERQHERDASRRRAILAKKNAWGRFQDADESAYYDYICRRAGIQVTYCAEQFENDGSPVSTIVKGVKRAMAGEYSRELSAKVFVGQCRLIELGFRQGGGRGRGSPCLPERRLEARESSA